MPVRTTGPAGTGGAHGSVHLTDELRRADNTGWGQACMELLAEAKLEYPGVSWADLIALGGAAAVQKCGGPVIQIGLGRSDASEVSPPHRLPGGYEGAEMLKRMFARMGLGPRELVALSGAHTLGHTQRKPFTIDPWVFSNAYYTQLVELKGSQILQTDTAMLDDPELRPYVELYARDEGPVLGGLRGCLPPTDVVGKRGRGRGRELRLTSWTVRDS